MENHHKLNLIERLGVLQDDPTPASVCLNNALLAQNACILSSANPDLTPKEAVQRALEIYMEVELACGEAKRRMAGYPHR